MQISHLMHSGDAGEHRFGSAVRQAIVALPTALVVEIHGAPSAQSGRRHLFREFAMSNPTATLNFPVPSALGTIDQYVTAVNKYPLLTRAGAGTRPALEVHADVDSARQLVMSHLRLVVSVSRNYMELRPAAGDLIQEGNVGLMKAVRRFDPERGVRL